MVWLSQCALYRTTPYVLVHLFMPVAPATLGRFDCGFWVLMLMEVQLLARIS